MGELAWTRTQEDGVVKITVRGTLTEKADFAGLLRELGPVCEIAADLDGINSTGVRVWLGFIDQAQKDRQLTFVNCSPAFVVQLNLIAGFAGNGAVRSVQAPYVCKKCQAVATRVIDVTRDVAWQVAAPFFCTECNSAMEFDDLPASYFGFVKRLPPPH